MWDVQFWSTKAVQYRIELEQSKYRPIYSALYRADPKAREFEKQEMERILHMNVIKPAQTEWATPIMYLPRNDGPLRFWITYRKLNAVKIGNL